MSWGKAYHAQGRCAAGDLPAMLIRGWAAIADVHHVGEIVMYLHAKYQHVCSPAELLFEGRKLWGRSSSLPWVPRGRTAGLCQDCSSLPCKRVYAARIQLTDVFRAHVLVFQDDAVLLASRDVLLWVYVCRVNAYGVGALLFCPAGAGNGT